MYPHRFPGGHRPPGQPPPNPNAFYPNYYSPSHNFHLPNSPWPHSFPPPQHNPYAFAPPPQNPPGVVPPPQNPYAHRPQNPPPSTSTAPPNKPSGSAPRPQNQPDSTPRQQNPKQAIDKAENASSKACRELLAAGDSVSAWKVSQKALLTLKVDSLNSLGIKMQQVPTLHRLMITEGKVFNIKTSFFFIGLVLWWILT